MGDKLDGDEGNASAPGSRDGRTTASLGTPGSTPGPAMRLQVLAGELLGTGFEIDLEDIPVVTIGRQPESFIYLEDSSVSRHHAAITLVDGRPHIEDLGSANGTFINDVRLTGRAPILQNMRIRFGARCLVVISSIDADVHGVHRRRDGLTNLYDDHVLRKALTDLTRNPPPDGAALVLWRVTNLDHLNRIYDREFGDQMLARVASVLQDNAVWTGGNAKAGDRVATVPAPSTLRRLEEDEKPRATNVLGIGDLDRIVERAVAPVVEHFRPEGAILASVIVGGRLLVERCVHKVRTILRGPYLLRGMTEVADILSHHDWLPAKAWSEESPTQLLSTSFDRLHGRDPTTHVIDLHAFVQRAQKAVDGGRAVVASALHVADIRSLSAPTDLRQALRDVGRTLEVIPGVDAVGLERNEWFLLLSMEDRPPPTERILKQLRRRLSDDEPLADLVSISEISGWKRVGDDARADIASLIPSLDSNATSENLDLEVAPLPIAFPAARLKSTRSAAGRLAAVTAGHEALAQFIGISLLAALRKEDPASLLRHVSGDVGAFTTGTWLQSIAPAAASALLARPNPELDGLARLMTDGGGAIRQALDRTTAFRNKNAHGGVEHSADTVILWEAALKPLAHSFRNHRMMAVTAVELFKTRSRFHVQMIHGHNTSVLAEDEIDLPREVVMRTGHVFLQHTTTHAVVPLFPLAAFRKAPKSGHDELFLAYGFGDRRVAMRSVSTGDEIKLDEADDEDIAELFSTPR